MGLKRMQHTVRRLAQTSSSLQSAITMQKWVEDVLACFPDCDLKAPHEFAIITRDLLTHKAEHLFSWLYISHKMESKRYQKLEFIYTKYDFVESHVEKITQSLDKTKWIISKYVDYVLNGTVPQDDPSWCISKKDAQLWFAWIEAMGQLYYGDIAPYTEALRLLKGQVA